MDDFLGPDFFFFFLTFDDQKVSLGPEISILGKIVIFWTKSKKVILDVFLVVFGRPGGPDVVQGPKECVARKTFLGTFL